MHQRKYTIPYIYITNIPLHTYSHSKNPNSCIKGTNKILLIPSPHYNQPEDAGTKSNKLYGDPYKVPDIQGHTGPRNHLSQSKSSPIRRKPENLNRRNLLYNTIAIKPIDTLQLTVTRTQTASNAQASTTPENVKKTPDTLPTCTNCKGPSFLNTNPQPPSHNASSPLLHIPSTRQTIQYQIQRTSNPRLTQTKQMSNTLRTLPTQKHWKGTLQPQTPTENRENSIKETLEEMKSTDLNLFIRIIDLIQKHYIKCTTNLKRVKAIILIVKRQQLDDGR